MGLFDTVHVSCPNCKGSIDIQTKSGECSLSDYTVDDMPMSVAEGILGLDTCHHCELCFIIEMITQPRFAIRKLRDGEFEDE